MGIRLPVGALVLMLGSPAWAKETVIDDFGGASSPAPWVFSNGAEFPGATGSLTLGAGKDGHGAALAYDFSGGGNYVGMTLTFPKPLSITALGFSAKIVGERTTLRIVDSTNQNLQYPVDRPLEATDAGAWFDVVVDLAAPASHFGGANDGALHQPLVAMSLLAGDGPQKNQVGTASFDSIVGWDALPSKLDPSRQPIPVEAGAFASGLGVNVHFTKDDHALDIARDAGFELVRMDLGWSGVEKTKGGYDFAAFDGLVAALAERQMKLLLILDYFNAALYPSANDDGGFRATTVPAFAAMAKATAAHFAGKGVLFEVWNEENGGFWDPSANASQYAALCKAAIAGVHAGDASAKVTTGGLAGFDFPFLEATLAAGGGAGADAVGVHPYRQGGGESASDDLVYLRAIVAKAYEKAPPIWDTEWAYSSTWFGNDGHAVGARATQAQRVSRELLSAWTLGFPVRVYYDIRDDGNDPANGENNFGLVQNDYGDKPAIVAVRTLSKVMAGRKIVGFVPVSFSSLHALVVDGKSDRLVALWSDASNSVTRVTLPTNTGTIVDVLGAPIAVANEVTVSEAAGPVFVTLPLPAANGAGGGNGAGAGGQGGDAGSTTGGGEGGTGAKSNESSGCGCVVAGRTADGDPILAMTALALFALGRRRRRDG